MKILLYLIIVVSLFLPFQADANGFLRGPIVPCGEPGNPCELCHFFVMANNIIQFLLELILVISPLFILIGGLMILVSAGVPDRVAFGKRIITYAVIGVVIALGAWTILRTLFNALIGGGGLPWPWNNPNCPI